MFIDKDESTLKENLSQPLQTKVKQFQLVITFPTGYIDIFNVTNQKKLNFFVSLFEGAEYDVITTAPRAYELETLENEKRINIDEGNTRLIVFNETKILKFE